MRIAITSRKGFLLNRKQFGKLDDLVAREDKATVEERRYFLIEIEGEDINFAEIISREEHK